LTLFNRTQHLTTRNHYQLHFLYTIHYTKSWKLWEKKVVQLKKNLFETRVFVLLGCHAAYVSSCLLSLRDSLSFPYSR